MQIFIKSLSGGILTLNVKLSDKVIDVKRQIESESKIHPAHQQLIFGGRLLKHDNTLESYGVQKESTLHLCTRVLFGYPYNYDV